MALTSILVDVPSRVQAPPNMDAKDSGISILEGLIFIRRAVVMRMGMKITTAAVLLIKAEMSAMIPMIIRIALDNDILESLVRRLLMILHLYSCTVLCKLKVFEDQFSDEWIAT